MSWIPKHRVYNINVETRFDNSEKKFTCATSATSATTATSMMLGVLVSIPVYLG
jgi:hypothetical protein